MKNRVEGFVTALDGTKATVRLSVHGSCSSCGSCGGAGASFIEAENRAGAQTGQGVIVEVHEQNMLTSAFIMYMLPLLAPVAGYIAGWYFSLYLGFGASLFRISGAVLLFACALLFIRFHDRRLKKSQGLPVIVGIRRHAE